MMDCKQALTEAKGDMEQAVVLLRKKGVSVAAKKATRVTSEGAVASYIHAGGKIGVLVEVNCESDFVARTDDFQNLVKEIGMHIAAASPTYARREDVPADVIERERKIYESLAREEGKPEAAWPKIVDGKINGFYKANPGGALVEQSFVKDQKSTVGALVAELGEGASVRRFARVKIGEE